MLFTTEDTGEVAIPNLGKLWLIKQTLIQLKSGKFP